MHPQPNNPLHGIKLQQILQELTEKYSREELYEEVPINCFKNNPTIKSSLKLLRNAEMQRARKKVEELYINTI